MKTKLDSLFPLVHAQITKSVAMRHREDAESPESMMCGFTAHFIPQVVDDGREEELLPKRVKINDDLQYTLSADSVKIVGDSVTCSYHPQEAE